MQNRLLGRWGEETVAADLRGRGWQVLAAGYRTRFGEIDLIVTNETYICFVEVKLRKSAEFGTAAEAVDSRKQRRIRATAEDFLAKHPSELQPRFDVAELYAPTGFGSGKPEIHYIENAF